MLTAANSEAPDRDQYCERLHELEDGVLFGGHPAESLEEALMRIEYIRIFERTDKVMHTKEKIGRDRFVMFQYILLTSPLRTLTDAALVNDLAANTSDILFNPPMTGAKAEQILQSIGSTSSLVPRSCRAYPKASATSLPP